MTEQRLASELLERFRERFGDGRLFSAPGRVNLIGEHTDYNEGFVLPIAIDKRTFVAGAARPDRAVTVGSSTTGTEFEFDLDHPGPPQRGTWLDYVEGTAQAMIARGMTLGGADLLIASDVPSGAGLSSSAALEMSVGYALSRLAGGEEPDLKELALSGQAAENDYVGARVGIMDQFISALAEDNSALLIDCRTLQATPVPLQLGSACVLICDTRVKHELASSAYNERRAQCEEGVAVISAAWPEVRSLRDVTLPQLAACAADLPTVVQRRCRHVVTENARTLRAVAALQAGQLEQLGALMSESHRSLRDDYEVSSAELDFAVEVACAEPGVYGSRMTGGGFGGCTVSVVERSALERVSETLRSRFAERFGQPPHLFASLACRGVMEHDIVSYLGE